MMSTQEKTCSPQLKVVSELRSVVGANNVCLVNGVVESEISVSREVVAEIKVASESELSSCFMIANKYEVPVYPISTGNNWGNGAGLPVQDGCVVLNLSAMNEISNFDNQLGYVTIQPGVTQLQLSKFLEEVDSDYYLCVTGSTPYSSVIGNLVERGDAMGPLSERARNACNLRVCLPSGEFIETGFGRFKESQLAPLSYFGVGPDYSGLFYQSNLGIVTRATIWLAPKNKYHNIVYFKTDKANMIASVNTLRYLKQNGLVSTSIYLWNDYKFVASLGEYPWERMQGNTPLSADVLASLRRKYGLGEWSGYLCVYGVNKKHLRVITAIVKKELKKNVKAVFHLTKILKLILRGISPVIKCFTGIDYSYLSKINPDIFLGSPTFTSFKSVLWRKKNSKQGVGNMLIDPKEQKCGLIWCTPTLPFTKDAVSEGVEITNNTCRRFGFEPNLCLIGLTDKVITCCILILYDVEVKGEGEKALRCHDELLRQFCSKGFYPSRLGVQGMSAFNPDNDGVTNIFLSNIKKMLDEKNILAPGRYEFNGKV